MTNRIKQLATKALEKDVFPKNIPYRGQDDQDPVEIGMAIAKYLEIQTYELREGEYLADKYRFFDLQNAPSEYYRALYGERERYLYSHNASSPTDIYYWGWTHIAFDFSYILNGGFAAYYERIENSIRAHADDAEKVAFLTGMKITLDGIINRYKKYAEMAKAEAEGEIDEDRKTALLRLADTLSRIPMQPAKSFFDAVQFTWIAFLLGPDSLGRIDQYLYPYYKHDIENGIISEQLAFELIEELFIKVYESQSDHPDLWHISGHNHLVVGGYTQNGEDGFNELSKVILEAIVDLPTFRPQASLRYTDKTPASVMRYVTEMNKKSQLIVFVNDEPRIRGMVQCGIEREDAIEYTVIGCNEWAITGKSKLDLAHASLVHPLESAIYNHDAPDTFEEFYKIFEAELKADFDVIISDYSEYCKAQECEYNVLTSIFHDNCIESGLPFTRKGAKYYGITVSYNSISNVADSLSIIKQFVYDEKRITFAELLCALKANWAGHEKLRAEILKHGHFFGNDDDYVDDIARAVVDSAYAVKLSASTPNANTIIIGSFTGATNPNIVLGKRTKATPDGRYNGEGFTMGISQSQDKDKSGVTALLSSISKLDYSKFCGCIVSNLKMDKAMADTPEKLDRLAAIYHTFLKRGGMQLQINYLSTEDLIKAQKNPENYKNLLVRVTGYSGLFTLFDTDLQNDIIKRTSQGC